jgi:hypothetical protein
MEEGWLTPSPSEQVYFFSFFCFAVFVLGAPAILVVFAGVSIARVFKDYG